MPERRMSQEDKQRLAIGTGLALAGGVGSNLAGQSLLKEKPKLHRVATPQPVRLAIKGKPGRTVTSLGARGAQVAGVGLAAGAINRARRGDQGPEEHLGVKGAAKRVAERSKMGIPTSVAEAKRDVASARDKDRRKAELAHTGLYSAGILGGAAGGSALGGKSVPLRAALSTAGAVGAAAALHPIAQRGVGRMTQGRMTMDDEGRVVRKSEGLTPFVKYVDPRADLAERTEIVHRKEAQRKLSLLGGTLGLTGAAMLVGPKGAKFASQGMKKPPAAVKRLAEAKPPYQAVSTLGAGVGGVGALNFSRISGKEAHREEEQLAEDKAKAKQSMWQRYGLGKPTPVGKALDQEDLPAMAAGAGVGALAAPMPTIRPTGRRADELQRLWNSEGAKATRQAPGPNTMTGSISPHTFANIAEKRGNRAQNTAYTAKKALAIKAGRHPPGEYTATLFRDNKGRVHIRQQDGRHYGEAKAMLGEDVPAKFHMVEGARPYERSGFKSITRAVRGGLQRDAVRRRINSPHESMVREAGLQMDTPKKVSDRLLAQFGHGIKGGDTKVTHAYKNPTNIRGKQAALIGGGALAGKVIRDRAQEAGLREKAKWAIHDQLVDRESVGKSMRLPSGERVRFRTIRRGSSGLDARDTVEARLRHQGRQQNIGYTHIMNRDLGPDYLAGGKGAIDHIKVLPEFRRQGVASGMLSHARKVGLNPQPSPVLTADGRALTNALSEHAKIKKALAGRELTREDKENIAGGATGAAGAGLLMPVRDKVNWAGRQTAKRPELRNLEPGKSHLMDVDSSVARRISSPGIRRHNIPYTTSMAHAIHTGKYKPPPSRMVVYDDTARFTGGQHRVHARDYAQQKTQPTEVIRVKGHYGGTEAGHKALRTKLKRAVFPTWFEHNRPKSIQDLETRYAAIDQDKLKDARKKATEGFPDYPKGWTKRQLRQHHGKQAAFLGAGTAAGLGAVEMKRRLAERRGLEPAAKSYLADMAEAVVVSKGITLVKPRGMFRRPAMRRAAVRRTSSGKMTHVRGGYG